MSKVAVGEGRASSKGMRFRGVSDAASRRPIAAIAAVLMVVAAGWLTVPALASAARVAPTYNAPASVATAKAPAKAAAHWKWSAAFNLGHVTGLKKHLAYGTYGLACPSTNLCIIPMDGTRVNPPYNSPAGDFYTTSPGKGPKGWHFSKWSEDYAPGDTLSPNSISCDPSGKTKDCNIAGREPVPGSYNESYGATVFQTGSPTTRNWGMSDVDTNSAGFGAVSCWVNVQCAEVDDNGTIYTTAGANPTSAVSVFPADAGFAGTWSVGCAPYKQGQHNFFCASVDQNGAGTIAWTVNPGQADTKWQVVNLHHHDLLFDVSCFGPGACLINNNGALILTKGDTGSKSWTKGFKNVTLPKVAKRSVSTIDCNEKLCAVAGESSKLGQYVAISTDPAHGHWQVTRLGKSAKRVLSDGIANVTCPSAKLCVVDNGYGQAVVGTR